MLRRRLWLMLGPVVGVMVVVAVVAIWLLQGVLHKMDHIRTQALTLLDQVNELPSTMTNIEATLYSLQLGHARHLDPLIDGVERMNQQVAALSEAYVIHEPPAWAAYQELVLALPQFTRHMSAMATTRDAELAAVHGQAALKLSVHMRGNVLEISRLVRDHVQDEQSALTRQFRWLVLGLTLVFLLTINLSVLVLMRAAALVLRPVDRLVEASRELGREHFEHRVDLGREDEFGELAQAYNRLAQQLQENERRKLEMLGQAAVTLNHELNNAITAIEMQLKLLERQSAGQHDLEVRLRQIHESLARMARTVQLLKNVRRIVLTDYADGLKMLDLERSVQEAPAAPAGLTAARTEASTAKE